MIDLVLAVLTDYIIGDPPKWPHPVRLMGNLIAWEDKLVRRVFKSDKLLMLGGLLIVAANICLAYFIPFYLLKLLKPYFYAYHLVNIYILYTCIAAKCLRDEALKIYEALSVGLDEARYRLSFIVGRDTKGLNEAEITRAAVETVAENTSDGVIAPLLYAMLGGVPLAVVYKMVNTMDSMLGYMNIKYRFIGYFPAKTDDLFNYIPARLTGVLMIFSSVFNLNFINGFKIMLRDRRNHKSPNCAYPEGAAAGLLGIQLGGTNSYFGEKVEKPTIGDRIRELEGKDIIRTIKIMYRSEILLVLIYIFLTIVI